jgi:cellulose synthase/poly-beta-1,6-N-acetylglucosamine synthase-like glycosyltransferase
MWATFLFGSVATMFVGMALTALWNLRWVHRLPSWERLTAMNPGPGGAENVPRCSVVIAARDEEARIEATVRHLFAQRNLEAEFIVVDDRSRDRTPDILRRLAKEEPRLRVKRVDSLPEGWLGKCHACHVGASLATGEWILFTDADCWLKPDVLARAIRVAQRERADHVTMAAGTVLKSTAAQGWYLGFLTGLAGWFAGVNRDRPKSHVGIGAFNLVRTDAYRQCGGYEALRLTVVDDIKLGLLLRRAGKRTRAFLGGDDVECHWGDTVGSMVRIMEKNYFAAVDYRTGVVLAATVLALTVSSMIPLGLFSGTAVGQIAAFSPFLQAVPASILARRVGWSWRCAAWVPSIFLVFIYTMLRSTFITLRRGGIHWRDTFYPLDVLRAGNVR